MIEKLANLKNCAFNIVFLSFKTIERKTVMIISYLFLFLATYNSIGQRIYLSGIDAADATIWDFKISTGRNSGYWTKMPVPSNWELHGFGYYTYGKDYEKYKSNPEIGYYRKTFQFKHQEDKRYRLTFEGVMTDTHVKINGKNVGSDHQGGFTQFSYEITDTLKDGINTIEVEVSKSSANESVQRSERLADYWLFGGIFRPVYIDVLPVEYIERVAIDADMSGTFTMDAFLSEITDAKYLRTQVLSANGEIIGKPIIVTIDAGKNPVKITSNFSNIKQWSHEFPTLYTAKVELMSGSKIIHSFIQKFGFRTFEVRDHDGFYLNGKRLLLKGANMHSFRPKTGRALSHEDMEENFQLLKELNFNCVRPCHYPPDEYFLTLCDSLGMLAMSELPGWNYPLKTKIGAKLVKELVVRDVNHPSIILWSNGNHRSHNPELDKYFSLWDIQDRRPLKNASKKEKIFEGYNPSFDIVDTRFYPSYEELTERLNNNHIVLPNECLHALYDGGGAASLKDYWSMFKKSKVGGGLMIWALYDEVIMRTDKGNQLDSQINKAPDGIVGPHGEKEGSYYAVKEIWSPIQIKMKELPNDFTGALPISNEFTFVNTSQCKFTGSLLDFAKPNEAKSGYRKYPVEVVTNDIPAGKKGIIHLTLPENWKTKDALQLKAWDNQGNEVNTWTWIINRKKLTSGFVGNSNMKLSQDTINPYLIQMGSTKFKFSKRTGNLKEISVAGEEFPIGIAPVLTYKSKNSKIIQRSELDGRGSVTINKKDNCIVVESKNINGFDSFTWIVSAQGYVTLEYSFTLPKGEYYYAGIGIQVKKENVLSKRWLGEGPSRIWKNRTEGGVLNVWDITKQSNIPGKIYNYPEFEGYFFPWYWSTFRLQGNHNLGVSSNTNGLILGVLNPVNGKEPKSAIWHYPEREGIYVFNYISPIGAKWREAKDFGPSGQPNLISKSCKGSVNLYFDWNTADVATQKFKIEIE